MRLGWSHVGWLPVPEHRVRVLPDGDEIALLSLNYSVPTLMHHPNTKGAFKRTIPEIVAVRRGV